VDRLRDAAQVVRNQQAAQAAMSAAQGPQLDALSDEDLAALVARLEASVSMKSRALDMLAGERDGAPAGFSRRLRAFGERHIEGIWLERLMLGPTVEQVGVAGSTLSADSVPRYLRSLAQDPALKGGKIDDFVIEKPDATRKSAPGRLSFRAGPRGLPPVPASGETAADDEEAG
jgi:hypothetical protein